MWRQSFPVTDASDDDLVAGVGQAVQSAVAEDGVIEDAEPLFHGPVAGDDGVGRAAAIDIASRVSDLQSQLPASIGRLLNTFNKPMPAHRRVNVASALGFPRS